MICMPQPKNLAPNLWIVDQPDFNTGFAKIGTRMTVIKLPSGGLFLHSPTKLDDETKRSLDAIGEVRAVVAPSRVHHLFVGDYIKTWPTAKLYGPPGLVGDIADFKARFGARRDLKLDAVLGDEPQQEWAGEIDQHLFKGAVRLERSGIFSPRKPIRDFHGSGIQRARRFQRRSNLLHAGRWQGPLRTPSPGSDDHSRPQSSTRISRENSRMGFRSRDRNPRRRAGIGRQSEIRASVFVSVTGRPV